MTKPSLGPVLAAVLAGVLWLASGAINGAMTWNGILGGSVGGVFPPTVQLYTWSQPQPWPTTAALVGAVAVGAASAAATAFFRAGHHGRGLFATSWLAVVVSGAVVGLASDIATIIANLPPARLNWLLDGLGTQAGIGAYWGFVLGWIPAVVVVIADKRQRGTDAAAGTPAAHQRRPWGWVVVAVAVLSIVGVGATSALGRRAALTESAQQEAIASGFDSDDGALPDPYAEGSPVPTVAPGDHSSEPDWCTPEQATVLLGAFDAATGHRAASITLMNFSATACVVEGYPDLAFADQNGHSLDVTVAHEGSFMTTDPGVSRVEIPAGGSAITYLGWNANATAGELVATTMFAAPFAGEARGSWPVETDITAGSTVAATAWALLPAG